MTKKAFYKLWTSRYHDCALVSHVFKYEFSDRWFRIHSLPESKRYADSDAEWKELLERQNEIITDLFGNGSQVILVTGEYNLNEKDEPVTEEKEALRGYDLSVLDSINLCEVDSGIYEEGQFYQPAIAEISWEPNQHDKLLVSIANDSLRAFFVSFSQNIIVAPYDGGIDIVLKNSETKDVFKDKYRKWLSPREDGL